MHDPKVRHKLFNVVRLYPKERNDKNIMPQINSSKIMKTAANNMKTKVSNRHAIPKHYLFRSVSSYELC